LPEPLALVVIGDPSDDNVPIETYRALFSLSCAEAALMAALVRGNSVGDWARERNVSVATVRTQLRSLFEKTGTDTQARLVGLAKAVPPIA
jgi:DNA-binding CsgD family transcriptional regulator